MRRVAKSFRTILWIGLVAGTLDITENIVFNAFRGVTPWRIFQFIASGLIDAIRFNFTVLSRRPILSGFFVRHTGVWRHEFHRAAPFGDSTATERRHDCRPGECSIGVDVLYGLPVALLVKKHGKRIAEIR
jgi:hypothetical protein